MFSSNVGIYTPKDKNINQDSYYADNIVGLYIVADGLGRYKHSKVASDLITRIIPQELNKQIIKDIAETKGVLQKAIRVATKELHKLGNEDPTLNQIATTLTLLFIHAGKYWIAQVGDSRAYFCRNKQLEQITDDHSIAFEQYRAGAIQKEDIQSHPNQQLLTRTISATKDFVLADIYEGDVSIDDVFLLCSDGLNKVMTDLEIHEVMNSTLLIEEKIEKFNAIVGARNGTDDTTIILVEV